VYDPPSSSILRYCRHSRKTIEEMMGGIDEQQKALITGGNAARVWNLYA
jgi:hypothetical protein